MCRGVPVVASDLHWPWASRLKSATLLHRSSPVGLFWWLPQKRQADPRLPRDGRPMSSTAALLDKAGRDHPPLSTTKEEVEWGAYGSL